MAFVFNQKKAVHVVLFMLFSLGRRADPSRLLKLIFLADLRHLARHGMLITGDSYLALKNGPAPVNLLNLFQKLKDGPASHQKDPKLAACLSINRMGQLTALSSYNPAYLSASEVECIFEILHDHKEQKVHELERETKGIAWERADANNEISLRDMAEESGSTPEMMAYIALAYKEELNLVNCA